MLGSRVVLDFRQIPPSANATVRRGCPARTEAEQRLEGGHRVPSPIVSKGELIEVDLQLATADTVIGANQPLLEVPDRAVGQGTTDLAPLRKSVLNGCV